MNQATLRDQAQAMRTLPKAEVHVHLEGCFEADTLATWARQSGTPLPRPPERLFQFDGLADFLQFLDWACGLAATPDRLAELSYQYCGRLAANGGGYADIIVNPTHWHAWHGRLGAMLDAIDAGFTAAEQDGLPPVGLCISLLRTQTAQQAAELVDALIDLRHPRVVALSIDGNEAAVGRTGPRFAEAFRRAGAAGLRRTVHAGESSGPDGVRDAITLLGADRIDHGVRAIDDPSLVALLAERQIALGVCPTSNLVLGVYPSIEAHPVELLRQVVLRQPVEQAGVAATAASAYTRLLSLPAFETVAISIPPYLRWPMMRYPRRGRRRNAALQQKRLVQPAILQTITFLTNAARRRALG
jgi:adenosine deaminase